MTEPNSENSSIGNMAGMVAGGIGKGFRRIGDSIAGSEADEARENRVDLTDPRQILTFPTSAAHSIIEEIWGVAAFVALVWIVFWADALIPFVNLNDVCALIPRTVRGLIGIPFMTFLHKDIGHLLSNSVPLFVLLTLLAGSRARSWLIVIYIMLLGGVLLWIFGRNGTPTAAVSHVGASMLVFGLVTFLIASAVLEKRIVPMIVAVVVGFLYGWTLLFGILPVTPGVSWDGHLAGAVSGVLVAYWCTQNWLTEEVRGLRDTLRKFEAKEDPQS